MPLELINTGTAENDGTGDWPRTVGAKINRMFSEIYTGKSDKGHKHPSSEITDATLAGRALLAAPDVAAQRAALGVTSVAALNDLADAVIAGPALGQELRHNGIFWENRDRTRPQFIAATGVTRLSRGVHQGGTVTVTSAYTGGVVGQTAGIALDGAEVGDGFHVRIRNRTGANWRVPAFPNLTLEFENGAGHAFIVSGRSAELEVYTRDGVRYACIAGATGSTV